jgi:hypothetical protein
MAVVADKGRFGRRAMGEFSLDVKAGTNSGRLLKAVHDSDPTFVSCLPTPSLCPRPGRSRASNTAAEAEWRRRWRRRATNG